MVKVMIVMGSPNDREIMKEAADMLIQFGVDFDWQVMSAHRTPIDVSNFCLRAYGDGVKIIIAAAGLAAHLAGAMAAQTTVPVFGVPLPGGIANGLDALLSTVQMPGGIPVATFGVGKHGARNAALMAVHTLAVVGDDRQLHTKLVDFRKRQAKAVRDANNNSVIPNGGVQIPASKTMSDIDGSLR